MTPKQEAALRLAADAIDEFCELGAIIRPLEVRDAIDEALAEPEEKYQYGTPLLDAMTGKSEQPANVAAVNTSSERVDKTAKNVHMQPAQQEPVAVVSGYYGGQCVVVPTNPARIFNSGTAFYTSQPPRKPWVGLTEEEIKDCFKITPDQHLSWHIYQRIEAKLKERNT